jgi:hypothetical protein
MKESKFTKRQNILLFYFITVCHITSFATVNQMVRILTDPEISFEGNSIIPYEAEISPTKIGSDQIHFKYVGPEDATVVIAIYNEVGQKVNQFTFTSIQNDSVFWTWNLTNDRGEKVKDGCYIAICRTESENNYSDGCRILLQVDTYNLAH